MPVTIPADKHPYSTRSPFDVLGVSVTATAVEVRDAHEQKIEEINDARYDDKTRLAALAELKHAYKTVSNPQSRASLELFWLADPSGMEECTALAGRMQDVSFDYGRILEKTDHMFSTLPNPEGADAEVRKSGCERPVDNTVHGDSFALDHRAHALETIAFDR